MNNWMDRAYQELEDDLSSGNISVKEYNQGMRDIAAEYDEQAREAAERTYNEFY